MAGKPVFIEQRATLNGLTKHSLFIVIFPYSEAIIHLSRGNFNLDLSDLGLSVVSTPFYYRVKSVVT